MVIYSMRCPKCGLIQMAAPNCKSCSAQVGEAAGSTTKPATHPTPTSALRFQPSVQREPLPFATGESQGLSFFGSGGSLFGIYVVNVFLTIITFGIYSFWGRVEVRRYLMSQTEFVGERLAYHGTGKELLLGFLKAMVVFGTPIALLSAVRDVLDVGEIIKMAAALVVYLFILFLIPFVTVAARRYRMSRTSWRGIRFSFRGHVWDFFKIFVGGSLLSAVTLGLYYPFFATNKYSYLTSHSYFGNQSFQFDGSGADLFGSYLLALLLTIPTLGLYWFWFMAKKQRHFVDHTSFATTRLESTVTGGALLLLSLGNWLLLIVTLGLGWAWVVVRNLRFAYKYIALRGPLDVEGIVQEAKLAPATGEELAGFFDLDSGFDIG